LGTRGAWPGDIPQHVDGDDWGQWAAFQAEANERELRALSELPATPTGQSRMSKAQQAMAQLARLADRFWSKVDRDGPVPEHCPELGNCWVWTGAVTGWGYGKFSVARSVWAPAHVVSWVLAHGSVPGGLFVLHRCDNPPCLRPSHLRPGTPKDNIQDMISKGRWGSPAARGVRNAHAKLTEAQVVAIRERFEAGELREALAAAYGVTPTTVGCIVNGRLWRHVGGPVRPRGQLGRRAKGSSMRMPVTLPED
jgi:hypothetical protein